MLLAEFPEFTVRRDLALSRFVVRFADDIPDALARDLGLHMVWVLDRHRALTEANTKRIERIVAAIVADYIRTGRLRRSSDGEWAFT